MPLDHAAALTVQLRLRAFAYAGATAQTVVTTINGHAYGPVTVGDAWQTLEFATAQEHWRAGVNRVRLDFAWARRPRDVGVSDDVRVLAAAVDYVRIAPANPLMVSNQRGHTSGVTTRAVWTLVLATGVWCAGCAVTRSEVKALRDRDSARVVFDAVVPTTVTALNELPAHCGPAGNRRRPPEELRVATRRSAGSFVCRREHDRDIHVVLADPQHPGDRIVVELGDPDTKSARRSPLLRDRVAAAWRTFGKSFNGDPAHRRCSRSRGSRCASPASGSTHEPLPARAQPQFIGCTRCCRSNPSS